MLSAPQITDNDARDTFRKAARDFGLDPDDRWVGDYVASEWASIRHILQSYIGDLSGQKIMEFGCNYGATSIVASHLGARVTGVDVDAENITLACANAAQYAAGESIELLHVGDTRKLPFEDGCFDVILCISVLEYVAPEHLNAVLAEIDRSLKPGGILIISGTASRIALREVHSGRWLINYVPSWIDRLFGASEPLQRGIKPWTIFRAFGRYENLDHADGLQSWAAARAAMGQSSIKLKLVKSIQKLLRPTGLTAAMLSPNIAVVYRKPTSAPLLLRERKSKPKQLVA